MRVFRRRISGVEPAPVFYRVDSGAALFMDDATGSGWNFQGCAITGKPQAVCLERSDAQGLLVRLAQLQSGHVDFPLILRKEFLGVVHYRNLRERFARELKTIEAAPRVSSTQFTLRQEFGDSNEPRLLIRQAPET